MNAPARPHPPARHIRLSGWAAALVLTALVSALPTARAAPATTEYAALCKQLDANRKTRYSGPCEGLVEHDAGAPRSPHRFVLTLPDKTEIEVLVYANGVARLNGVAAKRVTSPKGTVRVISGEEDELLFTDVPDSSL